MGPTEALQARVMQGAIWNTADRFLRSVVEPVDYGDFIIPFTVLRRLECLSTTPNQPSSNFVDSTNLSEQMLDLTIQHKFGLHFYNSSPLNLSKIASVDDKVLGVGVEDGLNDRPRIVLNDRSPAELFTALLASQNPSVLRRSLVLS